ncbi:hypothetical protein [Nostoc sp.]|uniref:hypothetical protein n=1 Tax=Nostoc sp. TaxID=1180 RepID=UPI002FFB7202
MAPITPGSNGTLKSVTAEHALVELVTILKNGEANTTVNPNKRNYVTLDFNTNTGSVAISFSIPSVSIITNTGSIEISANKYLSNLGFNCSTGGTFKSSTSAQTLIEIASYLQAREANVEANPENNNYTNFSYDGDNSVFGGTATIPFNVAIGLDGKPIINVVEYLVEPPS